MQCPSCGYPNPVDASFCGKCLTLLDRSRVKVVGGKRIFVPPQEEHIVRLRSVKRSGPYSYSWGWIVLLVLAIAALAVAFFYG